jgi:hypothetical protein
MKPLLIVAVCLVVLCALPWVVLGKEKVITTEVDVYRIRGNISGETSLTDNIWEGLSEDSPRARKGSFTFFTLANLAVANVKLEAREDGWTWDGKSEPPKGGKIDVLARPRFSSARGERFTATIGSQEPLQYFEKRPDGLFELKTWDTLLGISLKAMMDEGGSGRLVVRNLKIAGNLVTKRRPIEGVTLDVGAPIIEEYETTVSLKPDRYYGIELITEGQGFLLIRLRVSVKESP